jgi:hypothetical protein
LPVVDVATTAACQSEMAAIKLAETSYLTLNGHLATLPQLVTEQFLRSAPRYYTKIDVGAAGRYTLVGVRGKCGNVQVAE